MKNAKHSQFVRLSPQWSHFSK